MAKSKTSKKAKASRQSKASKRSAKAAKRSVKTAKRSPKPRRKAAKATKKAAGRSARSASKSTLKSKSKSKAKAKAKSAAPRQADKKVARKAATKTARRTAAAKTAPVRKAPAVVQSRQAAKARTLAAVGKKPNLDRERRVVRERDDDTVPSPPSTLDLDRSASAARTGRAEYEERLRLHTSTGPAMTGGDVDASWEDAESVGGEAPGGDSPTPDQDIVDEIGKALGVEYEDDEELQGGDELAERDRRRWELDPASKDDFEEEP